MKWFSIPGVLSAKYTNYIRTLFFCFILIISNTFYGKENILEGDLKPITFEKKNIKIGKVKLKVEIADTSEKTAKGLMHRKKLSDNEGMLFIFQSEEPRSFWMKNTFVDLSIAFIDKQKKIIDIQDMKAVKSEMEINPPSYQSRFPAQFALEVRLGWFMKNNIKVGDKIVIFDKK